MNRDIVVIGGSSGSTEVLVQVVTAIPSDSTASWFISTHLPAKGPSHLAELLARHCALPVVPAVEGAAIEPGKVYVAVVNRHLLLGEGGIQLGKGPRENMSRPSVDPMFRSAALTFGPRVIGVVLSGMLGDGASGLTAIKACGGMAVVQDPTSAAAPGMPRAAIAAADVDHVVAAADLGVLVADLTNNEAGPEREPPAALALEVDIALGSRLGVARLREIADPAPLSCPDCQGVLSEVRNERPLRFRCQTGHAVSADVLADQQDDALEAAMRVALRIMEERVELVTRMAEDARNSGRAAVAELYEARITEYGDYAETLRQGALQSLKLKDESDGSGD